MRLKQKEREKLEQKISCRGKGYFAYVRHVEPQHQGRWKRNDERCQQINREPPVQNQPEAVLRNTRWKEARRNSASRPTEANSWRKIWSEEVGHNERVSCGLENIEVEFRCKKRTLSLWRILELE